MIKYCECGCGQEVKNRFVSGHNSRGRKGITAPMYGKHHTEESKQKMSISSIGKSSPLKGYKHSEKTKQKMSESHKNIFFGEKNPNYKDGNKCKLENWKKEVKERDQYTCRNCLIDLKCINMDHIAAHHILPKREYPDLIHDIDNGITLCASCHAKYHNSHRNKKNKIQKIEIVDCEASSKGI